MEETISLDEIFQLLKKKMTLIICMMFVGLGISAGVTYFLMTPKYSSSTQIIVQTKASKDTNLNTDSINSNLLLINTYKDLIKSQVVVDDARQQLEESIGYTGTSTDIKDMLSVDQNQSSQMFMIKATSENPEEAAEVANVVATIFQREADETMDADKISIVSKAEVNDVPVSPNKTVNLAIGMVLGLVVGVMIALIAELFDRTVKSENFVSETVGIPILGVIPTIDEKEIKSIKTDQYEILESGNFEFDAEYNPGITGEIDLDGLDSELNILSETIDLADLEVVRMNVGRNKRSEQQVETSDDVTTYSRTSRRG